MIDRAADPSRFPITLKLAVFDLDGTLKAAQSPYHFVHRALGVDAEAAQIHLRYQRGDLDYTEWGQQEIGLWRGLPVEQLRSIVRTIPYLPGALCFVRRLKAAGVTVALISAGFGVHVELCAAELSVDVTICNHVEVTGGRLTGELLGDVGNGNKGRLVRELQVRNGVSCAETLAAGDTLADVQMFSEAAVSVAVAPAEPAVAEAADLLLPDGNWARAWELIEGLRPGWLPPRTAQ